MPQPYEKYIRGQWLLGAVDESFVEIQVTKGRLTREEADAIKQLPRGE